MAITARTEGIKYGFTFTFVKPNSTVKATKTISGINLIPESANVTGEPGGVDAVASRLYSDVLAITGANSLSMTLVEKTPLEVTA